MIWIWSVPDNYPNKRIGEYIKNSGTDRFVFREARVITEEIVAPKIVFECEEKHLSDILPNSGSLLVVSKKVLDLMEEICPQDIQAFEANVCAGAIIIPDYYIINVVNAVEVLNKEESDFSTIKGTNAILKFERIVYKFSELPNNHIARNADYKSHVLVSDALKEAFEENKIKGVQFS